MENVDAFRSGIERVKSDIEIISKTDGWHELSKKQKQFVSASLITQSRATRKTDSGSALAVNDNYLGRGEIRISSSDELRRKLEAIKKPYPENREYEASQERIAGWNCHRSIFTLENLGEVSSDKYKLDDDFMKCDYRDNMSISSLRERIEEVGYPCVVHISDIENNDHIDLDEQRHSFVVFGNLDGKAICWEKKDYHMPYQVATLEEIFMRYPDSETFWGVRQLKDR